MASKEIPDHWSLHPEIHHHLNLVPYIDLGVSFDNEALLQEARNLRSWFVAHRNYDQGQVPGGDKAEGGRWMSLSLRAIAGDHRKTLHYTDYGYQESPDFKITEAGKLCPKTMAFLQTLTDVDRCERIRFMLLEPGAKIFVHRDHPGDVAMAVNISLNMPEGCHFYADTYKNGEHHNYTVRVPFSDKGSVIVFNIAKYHYVENRGNEDRIHIIFHGPLKMDEGALLAAARRQNGLFQERKVLAKIFLKKAELGEKFSPLSFTYRNWLESGAHSESLPPWVKVVVVDFPQTQGKELQEYCLNQITRATLYPLGYEVIQGEDLDSYLDSLSRSEAGKEVEFVLLVGAGTFISQWPTFLWHVQKSCFALKRHNALVAGLQMKGSSKGTTLPYLHEQLAILNFTLWGSMGRPTLGLPRNAPVKYGARLLAASLETGGKAHKLPKGLRESIWFAYPEFPEGKNMTEIKEGIELRLQVMQKYVYFMNNEPPQVVDLPHFHPERLVTVAAGFKPFGIASRYWGDRRPADVVFLDYSQNSLQYMQVLLAQDSYQAMLEAGEQYMRQWQCENGGPVDPKAQIPPGYLHGRLRSQVIPYFTGGEEELLENIKKLRGARLVHHNFVKEPQALIDLFHPDCPTLAWISNAWNCHHAYYWMSKERLDEHFLGVARAIAGKLKLRSFKRRQSYEVLFGEDLGNIHSVLTDGVLQGRPDFTRDYVEVTFS